MRRTPKLIACATLLGLLVPTGADLGDSDSAQARRRYVKRSTRLQPGLRYTRILDRVGPKRIKVLKVNPSVLTMDVELARDRLPGRETTSSMAERRNAVAAVNGTFGLPWGRPVGLFAEDSTLQASPLVWGNAFAMSSDRTSTFIGHPGLSVSVDGGEEGPVFGVARWNTSEPHGRRVSGYTPAGGRFARPPSGACQARLAWTGVSTWSPDNAGVERTYAVDKVRCGDRALRRKGETVVSAPPGTRGAKRILSLSWGQVVDLTWSIGWPGVLDAIAGNPVLVADGRNIGYTCSTYFCRANPRTGIGVTPKGRILLVTVDGRQPGHSVGMTLREFGALFVSLNATSALNLDGGGSTTMVIDDEMVNRSSDPAGERDVSSSILILDGTDPEEPVLAPAVSSSSSGGGAIAISPLADPSVTDPASTGGLLDALEKGVLHHRKIDLRPELDGIDDLFDAAVPGL